MERLPIQGVLLSSVAALVLGVAPGEAYSYPYTYLQNTIMGTMSQQQSSAFSITFMKALSSTPDGASVQFQLPDKRQSRGIEGTITP
ncbi:hypothetical protein ACU4GI_20605 [Cupriavidus basilensis]